MKIDHSKSKDKQGKSAITILTLPLRDIRKRTKKYKKTFWNDTHGENVENILYIQGKKKDERDA